MTPLKRPELGEIYDVRKRLERLAASFVVFAGQTTKSVRVVVKMDTHTALSVGDWRFAARAPWPARLVAAKCSIKRHRIVPRKFSSASSGSHVARLHPRQIWSQLPGNSARCGLGVQPRNNTEVVHG